MGGNEDRSCLWLLKTSWWLGVPESRRMEGHVLQLSIHKVATKVMGQIRLTPKGDNIGRNIGFKE